MSIRFVTRDAMARFFLKPGMVGCETGPGHGEFSGVLRSLRPRLLYLADPFSGKATICDRNGEKGPEVDMADMYLEMIADYEGLDDIVLVREKPAVFLESLPDGRLDYIYINGDGTYEDAMRHLTLAHKKVRKGGYIMGSRLEHNRLRYTGEDVTREVKRAVTDFCKATGLSVTGITDDGIVSFAIRT